MKKLIVLLVGFGSMLVMVACSSREIEYRSTAEESKIENGNVSEGTSEIATDEDMTITDESDSINWEEIIPQKDEVEAMRETVLDGMSDDDIETLCDFIKNSNRWLESKIIYNNFFYQLSDPDDLIWNYFDESGEIQIGWAYDDVSIQEVMDEEGLTEDEFYEKYGSAVVTYNECSAEDFAQILESLKETVKNEALRYDLQQIIDEARLASETHDVEHAKNMYYLLHDMDYWLLNYRLDTEGQYILDKSTISKFYGVLSVYN